MVYTIPIIAPHYPNSLDFNGPSTCLLFPSLSAYTRREFHPPETGETSELYEIGD